MTTTMNLNDLNALQDRYQRIFDILCNPTDWRAPIDVVLAPGLMESLGWTRADIREAVEWFTATAADILMVPEEPGALRIRAKGYRMGPAGP